MNNETQDSTQAESEGFSIRAFGVKKILALIGGAVAVCLVLVIAANWSLVQQIATFSPIIMPSAGPEPANEAEARLRDIEYLAALLDYDRSFDEGARGEFEQLMAGARQEAETMSLADLYLLAAEATALADNGHTNISTAVQRDFNFVGLRFFHFQDGLYVVRALAGHEPLIGARVLEIDGQPIDAVLAALYSYVGGPEQWRRLYAADMLESAEILHAAGLADSPDGYSIMVQDQQGTTQQVDLAAQPAQSAESAPFSRPWGLLEAGPLPGEGDAWVGSLQAVSEDRLPLYLQQTNLPYWWAPLENGGGYVRLQTGFNTEQQSLAGFFEENIAPLPDGSLDYLVVDLRPNDGGDFTQFVEIAKWLPDKVAENGRLYVAVGPQTFSGGLQIAALLKYYGGEKTSLIGSPMGDREQFWAERGLDFILPSSGFRIGYATGYHDWADGCEEHPYCYTPYLKHGVKAGSLTPDHIIEPLYADYAAGRDVIMDWIDEQEQP